MADGVYDDAVIEAVPKDSMLSDSAIVKVRYRRLDSLAIANFPSLLLGYQHRFCLPTSTILLRAVRASRNSPAPYRCPRVRSLLRRILHSRWRSSGH